MQSNLFATESSLRTNESLLLNFFHSRPTILSSAIAACWPKSRELLSNRTKYARVYIAPLHKSLMAFAAFSFLCGLDLTSATLYALSCMLAKAFHFVFEFHTKMNKVTCARRSSLHISMCFPMWCCSFITNVAPSSRVILSKNDVDGRRNILEWVDTAVCPGGFAVETHLPVYCGFRSICDVMSTATESWDTCVFQSRAQAHCVELGIFKLTWHCKR